MEKIRELEKIAKELEEKEELEEAAKMYVRCAEEAMAKKKRPEKKLEELMKYQKKVFHLAVVMYHQLYLEEAPKRVIEKLNIARAEVKLPALEKRAYM